MDPALATLAQRMQHTPGRSRARGRPRAEETLPEAPKALVAEEQGGLARLQIRTVLPWSQALEILRILADAQAGTDQNSTPY